MLAAPASVPDAGTVREGGTAVELLSGPLRLRLDRAAPGPCRHATPTAAP